jgi:hypothetical protein
MRNENEIREEIEGLRSLTTAQLKEKYREVFSEQSRADSDDVDQSFRSDGDQSGAKRRRALSV